MVFEAGGFRALVAWKVEVLSLFLASLLRFQKPRKAVFRRRFVAFSSFTAMVFEAGGSRVLAAWKVKVLSLFLASSLVLSFFLASSL